MPLLRSADRPERWRGAFLVEQEETYFNPGPAGRRVLEPQDPFEQLLAAAGQGVPAYAALRTATHAFVVYGDGERELCDLRSDPYELANIILKADRSLVNQLDAWLTAFLKCHGAQLPGCRRCTAALAADCQCDSRPTACPCNICPQLSQTSLELRAWHLALRQQLMVLHRATKRPPHHVPTRSSRCPFRRTASPWDPLTGFPSTT